MDIRVHLLKRVAGPNGNHAPGETITVTESEAKGLVEAGAAERLDAMQPYRTADDAQAMSRETATPARPRKARK